MIMMMLIDHSDCLLSPQLRMLDPISERILTYVFLGESVSTDQ